MSDQLTREVIDRLAEWLGTTGPHVYDVLLRQQYINAAVLLTFSVTWLVAVSLVGYHLYQRCRVKPDERSTDFFMGTVIFGAGLVVFLSIMSDVVARLLNPEYYAIRELLRMLTGAK